MEELLEKIDNLKKTLNNEDTIININDLNKRIINDKELLKLVNEYKNNPSKELKQRIYKNNLFREYKKNETDLNIIIMNINHKLKEINNRRNCQ